MPTRRQFLIQTPLALLALPSACSDKVQHPSDSSSAPAPGAPPTFGTAAGSGPPVTTNTFVEAEKLAQVTFSPSQRQEAADSWRGSMAPYLERRTGPRKFVLSPTDSPATGWNPAGIGASRGPSGDRFVRSAGDVAPLPSDDADIAFAPVSQLSRWIEARKITSTRLTNIYLDRITRLNPRINAIITLTRDQALSRAAVADREIAAGHYRGPLHGIAYGVKDLLDTANIPTTYGAEPFRARVPTADSAVVRRLDNAGAVLVAKLSMGALALNDIWFGGQTMNPWVPEEGASGSSAGPGAATAAGLVAFAIGSETDGSIVSPSMRCGVTGLRPTFGRVPRSGAMTLCWTLDKLGPMTRSVEDTMLVLQAITGPDAGDVYSVPSHLSFDASASVKGLKVGYIDAWMRTSPATDVDRHALDVIRSVGMIPVAVTLPDWPYDSMMPILFAEAAASFEELTLTNQMDTLRMQVKDAWPNLFRQARFLSAVDMVQADRMRRRVAQEFDRIFTQVDLLLVPSLRDEQLTITNFTGHPSLTMRAGFVEVSEARSDWAPDPAHPLPKFAPPRQVPHGITLIGPLFADGRLGEAGLVLERALDVMRERPAGF